MMNILRKTGAAVFIVCFLFVFSGHNVLGAADTSRISATVIEKSGKDLKDYQVSINLNEGNFSFDADKDRLSFTDENDTKLNYWIEKWNSGAKEAKIWVKIPELKANETKTIFMDLNGNDMPDGDKTFDFFDDFEKPDLDLSKWQSVVNGVDGNTNDVYLSGGIMKLTGSIFGSSPGDLTSHIVSRNKFSGNVAIMALEKNNMPHRPSNSITLGFRGESGSVELYRDASRNYMELDNAGNTAELATDWTYAAYSTKEIIWDKNTPKISWNENGVEKQKSPFVDPSRIPAAGLPVFIQSRDGAEQFLDWVLVRQYTFPEPEAILGEDISISGSSLSISNQGGGKYLVKGKISSTFKDNLENIVIAIYDKDPKDSASRELARITLDKIEPKKDADFEIIVSADKDKTSELYIFADPDNKIAESNKANNIAKKKILADITETLRPFLASFVVFLSFVVISVIFYFSYRNFKKNNAVPNPTMQTKTCLNCGMVLDKSQSKCPVCGMGVFKA